MFFRNSDELFKFLKDYYIKNGGKIDISTFGMYLGISQGKDWSYKYYNSVRDFINIINKEDLRLILGLPYYMECKPGCKDCKNKYNNILERHKETVEKLNLNIKYHSNLHLKMYRIGDLYVSGGINLSASNNIDASFIITDKEQKKFLQNLFNEVWQTTLNSDIKEYKKVG